MTFPQGARDFRNSSASEIKEVISTQHLPAPNDKLVTNPLRFTRRHTMHEKPLTESIKPSGPLTYVIKAWNGNVGRLQCPSLEAAWHAGKVVGYVNTKGGVTAL